MTRWVLGASAADDLECLVDFLLEQFPDDAVHIVDRITDALHILEHHPRIGRPCESALRELVISRVFDILQKRIQNIKMNASNAT